MGKGYRQGRLGEEIRKIVSELLLAGTEGPGAFVNDQCHSS